MASGSRSGLYYCTICNLKFPFKSKLERHLSSDDHRLYAECLQVSDITQQHDSLLQDHFSPQYDEIYDDHGGAGECSHQNTSDDDGAEESDFELDMDDLLQQSMDAHGDYKPFPNKHFALLFLLMHSPRPMGETNLKFVWFAISQCGVSVPSFSDVKNFKLPGLISPIRCQTLKSIPFHMNTATSIVQRCIANPVISQTVQRFPVIPNGPYREMFHASRWLNGPRFFSPMTCLPDGTHVFIRDCVHCRHPTLGTVTSMVVKFFMKEGECDLYAELNVLLTLEQYRLAVPDTLACYLPYGMYIIFETVSLPVDCIIGLCSKPLSLLRWDHSSNTVLQLTEPECSAYLEPHPLRERAAGKPVVMLPLVLFSDDTSGNKSKKWHLFDSWSMVLAGLPRHENSKVSNIHFLCCSDSVSAMEMTEAIAPELICLEKEGIEAYDALQQQPVLVVSPVMCIVADNPRASEILNHLGGAARKYCRICMVDKEVNPTQIGEYRTLAKAIEMMHEIRALNTEKDKSQRRTTYGIKEAPNPMLTLPVDLFRSTPVETLHTILLGPYKYLLKSTIPKLSARQKEEILARIRSFNYSGFRVRLIGNVVRYHKSFVGRDYKAWGQMALFIICPYLNEQEVRVWLTLSKVFKIAYSDYFDPTKADEWNQICQAFVTAVQQCQPDMLNKQKVHLMLHLVECMKEFGPSSSFNSERFETFNSFIRTHNIYGNKGAPSYDIACRFATLEHLRHIGEGGYFMNGERCGEDLKKLFSSSTVQHFINCIPVRASSSNKAIYQVGALRKRKTRATITLSCLQLMIPDAPGVSVGDLPLQQPPFAVHFDDVQPHDPVDEFHGVIGQDGELIHKDDYVELSSHRYEMKYGQLLVCVKTGDGRLVCIVRGFEAMESPLGIPITNEFDCPLLCLSRTIFTIKSSDIVKACSFHCSRMYRNLPVH